MRIQPVFRYNNSKKVNSNQTRFEKKNSKVQEKKHNNSVYTGIASVDLAYASMFDKVIANDLKSMGLI